MTLPAAPPISLSQVCTEFGAPANTPLSAFLRGGAWVPNSPLNAGVPTALPIGLLDMLGATALAVAISNQSVSSVEDAPADATSTYQMTAAGVVNKITSNGGTVPVAGEWLVAGTGADFDVMATLSSGTAPTGSALATWLNLGTTRAWTLTRADPPSGGGTNVCVLAIAIRPAGGGATMDTANISMSAQVIPP